MRIGQLVYELLIDHQPLATQKERILRTVNAMDKKLTDNLAHIQQAAANSARQAAHTTQHAERIIKQAQARQVSYNKHLETLRKEAKKSLDKRNKETVDAYLRGEKSAAQVAAIAARRMKAHDKLLKDYARRQADYSERTAITVERHSIRIERANQRRVDSAKKAADAQKDLDKALAENHRKMAERAVNQAREARYRMREIGSGIADIGKQVLAVGVAVTGVFVAIGKSGLEMNDAIKQATFGLSKTLESMDNARTLMAGIREDAKTSFLTFKEMLPITQRLASVYGPQNAGRVRPTMLAVGNVSAVNRLTSGEQERAFTAITNLVTRNTLNKRWLDQLSNALKINVYNAMKQMYGDISVQEMQARGIGGEKFVNDFVKYLNTKFKDAQKKIVMGTLPGIWSYLTDSFRDMTAKITERFLPRLIAALNRFAVALDSLASGDNLRVLRDAFERMGDAIIYVIDKLTALIKWFNNLSPQTKELIARIVVFTAKASLLGGAVGIVVGKIVQFIANIGLAYLALAKINPALLTGLTRMGRLGLAVQALGKFLGLVGWGAFVFGVTRAAAEIFDLDTKIQNLFKHKRLLIDTSGKGPLLSIGTVMADKTAANPFRPVWAARAWTRTGRLPREFSDLEEMLNNRANAFRPGSLRFSNLPRGEQNQLAGQLSLEANRVFRNQQRSTAASAGRTTGAGGADNLPTAEPRAPKANEAGARNRVRRLRNTRLSIAQQTRLAHIQGIQDPHLRRMMELNNDMQKRLEIMWNQLQDRVADGMTQAEVLQRYNAYAAAQQEKLARQKADYWAKIRARVAKQRAAATKRARQQALNRENRVWSREIQAMTRDALAMPYDPDAPLDVRIKQRDERAFALANRNIRQLDNEERIEDLAAKDRLANDKWFNERRLKEGRYYIEKKKKIIDEETQKENEKINKILDSEADLNAKRQEYAERAALRRMRGASTVEEYRAAVQAAGQARINQAGFSRDATIRGIDAGLVRQHEQFGKLTQSGKPVPENIRRAEEQFQFQLQQAYALHEDALNEIADWIDDQLDNENEAFQALIDKRFAVVIRAYRARIGSYDDLHRYDKLTDDQKASNKAGFLQGILSEAWMANPDIAKGAWYQGVQADVQNANNAAEYQKETDRVEGILKNAANRRAGFTSPVDNPALALQEELRALEGATSEWPELAQKFKDRISELTAEIGSATTEFGVRRQDYIANQQIEDLKMTSRGRSQLLARYGVRGRYRQDAAAEGQAIDLLRSAQDRMREDARMGVATSPDFLRNIQEQVNQLIGPRSVWKEMEADAKNRFGNIKDDFADAVGEMVAKGGSLKTWWKSLWSGIVSWFTSTVVKRITGGIESMFSGGRRQQGGGFGIGDIFSGLLGGGGGGAGVGGAALGAGTAIAGAGGAGGGIAGALSNALGPAPWETTAPIAPSGGPLAALSQASSLTSVLGKGGFLSKILGKGGFMKFLGKASPWIAAAMLFAKPISNLFKKLFGKKKKPPQEMMFDDPANDMMAQQSGYDFTREFNKGVSKGMAKLTLRAMGRGIGAMALMRHSTAGREYLAGIGGYNRGGPAQAVGAGGGNVININHPVLFNRQAVRDVTEQIDREMASRLTWRFSRGIEGGRDSFT